MSEREKLIQRVVLGVRVLLGIYIIVMGVMKARDPVAFMKIVREYGWVESPFPLNVVAAWLPWFEIFCGILLISGFLLRPAVWSLILLLMAFTPAVIYRGYELAQEGGLWLCEVKFDCGCGAGVIPVCWKIFENTVTLILLGFVIWKIRVPKLATHG